jgi:hypothetical protein
VAPWKDVLVGKCKEGRDNCGEHKFAVVVKGDDGNVAQEKFEP